MKVLVLAVCLLATTTLSGEQDREKLLYLVLNNGEELPVYLPEKGVCLGVGEQEWVIKPNAIRYLSHDGWVKGLYSDLRGRVKAIDYAVPVQRDLEVYHVKDHSKHHYPWYKIAAITEKPGLAGGAGYFVAEEQGSYHAEPIQEASIQPLHHLGVKRDHSRVCETVGWKGILEIDVPEDDPRNDYHENELIEEVIFLSHECDPSIKDFLDTYFGDVS